MDNLFAKLERFCNDELGTVKDVKAYNWLMPSSKLQFYKVCMGPMALQKKAEQELDHLERARLINWTRSEHPKIHNWFPTLIDAISSV